jgi:RecA/RadA recombinase
MAARRKPAKKEQADVLDAHLSALQSEMNKEFGADTAVRGDSSDVLSTVDKWISTRSIAIDKVVAGGRPLPCSVIPYGRQVEISGPPHAGKTTACAQTVAEAQRDGALVIVTDTEERIDKDYWKALGVDCGRYLNLRADTLEEVFEKQYRAILKMKKLAPERDLLMLWDSVGGTRSRKVMDEESKTTFMERAAKIMGRNAKVIGDGVNALNEVIPSSNVCYLYTNHVYTKMNVQYGDPMETYGGNRLKFLATLRLRLTPGKELREEDQFGNVQSVGKWVNVKSLKNSMAPMLMTKRAVVMGGLGFSNEYLVWDVAKQAKWITTAGGWSTWETPKGEKVKFQGWTGFQAKVAMHPEYIDLENMVRASY